MKLIIKQFFLFSILLLALPAMSDYQPIDLIKVIVDDDVITQSDIDTEIATVKKNLSLQQNIQQPSAAEISEHVLNSLILKSLQLQLALKSGMTISDEQLTKAVTSIAERNGFNNQQDFRLKLEAEGLSYQDMREKIRQDLTIQRLQQGLLHNKIQVNEQEINNFLASAEGKKITATRYKVSHILLPVNSISSSSSSTNSSSTNIKQAEKILSNIRQQIINNHYAFADIIAGKNIDGYTLNGASLGWSEIEDLPSLFAKVVTGMQKGEISQPLQSGAGWHLVKLEDKTGGSNIVHQTSVRHILIKPSEVRTDEQVKKLADSIYQRIQEGEDFALLAKEYSEDPGSALQGGDLGWSSPKQFVPAFEQTMNQLKDMEVSKPFQTGYGWHIMQKMGTRDHDMTAENWKNQAYQAIYERKFADELEAWLQKIRAEAFVEIKQ